tara:strand:+ start:76 stop:639 length:564 start_codon:yes stop_codon:yes gene_type:complete
MKDCLSDNDNLTDFGQLARHFPQAGGLVIASTIYKNKIKPEKILDLAELMAACSLAYFKKIPGSKEYKFPWSEKQILKELKSFYPDHLFPELYEKPYKDKSPYAALHLRDYNPQAGFIIRMWNEEIEWNELISLTTSRHFGPGDVSNCLLRTCSYLQALSQAIPKNKLAVEATKLRKKLLRPPILVI